MSVVLSKRGTSERQFIDTAKQLELFTLKTVVNFPKRYTFYISQKIFQSAERIYKCLIYIDSCSPTNEHELQSQKDHFIIVKSELQNLISQISIAKETFPIADSTITTWMELINDEIYLVNDKMNQLNLPN